MQIHVNNREEKFDRRRCASTMIGADVDAANFIRVASWRGVFARAPRSLALRCAKFMAARRR